MSGQICWHIERLNKVSVGGSLLVERECQHQVCNNDGRTLKVDRLPAIVAKIADFQHRGVGILAKLRKKPLEVCKKRRIVQSPF